MKFRYQDANNRVHTLPDVASFLRAIRDGQVAAETPLVVGTDRSWQPAGSVAAYREALEGLKRSGGVIAVAPEPPPAVDDELPLGSRPIRRGRARAAAMAAVAILALGFVGFRIHILSARPAKAAGPSRPNLAVQAVLLDLRNEYGDSIAVAQHRLHEWVRGQRFDVRFRGISLASAASLREALVAVERYRLEVNELVSVSRRFSLALLDRADSLELSNRRLDGLVSYADDDLSIWRRDLESWADIHRAAAASLDSIADFLIAKEAAYTVREGRAVFTSRADGERFQTLLSSLASFAAREQAWADQAESRRPGWLSRIPPASRPAFGRAILH